MKKPSYYAHTLADYFDSLSGIGRQYAEASYSRSDNNSARAVIQDVVGSNIYFISDGIYKGLKFFLERPLNALDL